MNALATGSPTGAVEGARRSDLVGIRWLLNQHSLPSADITEHSLDHFLVYRDEIGVAGREGAPALLKQSSQFKTLCPFTAVLMVKP
jgi:hypothetical protein